jgi:hypothetical protein
MARGKILRDTNAGDGIIFVGEKQVPFSLEKHWRSGVPPQAGMMVDVVMTADGAIESVTQIDETQLAKEQAQKAWNTVSTQGRMGAAALAARVGIPTLATLGVVLIAWLFLNTLSVRVAANHSIGITFYDLLKAANSGMSMQALGVLGTASAGIYGLLMWVALLAPIASHFHSNRHLAWGYCAPLAYMVGTLAFCYFGVKSELRQSTQAASEMANMFGGSRSAAMLQGMADEMISRTWAAFSVGLGLYVALIAAGYLAFIGVRRVLAHRANQS